jgi:hypothetical protein
MHAGAGHKLRPGAARQCGVLQGGGRHGVVSASRVVPLAAAVLPTLIRMTLMSYDAELRAIRGIGGWAWAPLMSPQIWRIVQPLESIVSIACGRC